MSKAISFTFCSLATVLLYFGSTGTNVEHTVRTRIVIVYYYFFHHQPTSSFGPSPRSEDMNNLLPVPQPEQNNNDNDIIIHGNNTKNSNKNGHDDDEGPDVRGEVHQQQQQHLPAANLHHLVVPEGNFEDDGVGSDSCGGGGSSSRTHEGLSAAEKQQQQQQQQQQPVLTAPLVSTVVAGPTSSGARTSPLHHPPEPAVEGAPSLALPPRGEINQREAPNATDSSGIAQVHVKEPTSESLLLSSAQQPHDQRKKKQTQKEIWHAHYERLRLYEAQHHNQCCVPRDYPDDPALAHFVSNQRKLYRACKLPTDRKILLDQLGFSWIIKHHRTWDDNYHRLLEYQKQQSDHNTNVPCQYSTDRALGSFVNFQRRKYREGTLSQHHQKLLEDIGFEWTVPTEAQRRRKSNRPTLIDVEKAHVTATNEKKWNDQYVQLQAYHQKHGRTFLSFAL